MTVAQTAVRESLYRRILELPDEGVNLVSRYVEDLKEHEPNEETTAAILEGDKLARIYCSRLAENEDASATR